jgi:CHAT domain-containing protein
VHVATHGFFLPARAEDTRSLDPADANGELLPGLRSGVVCAGANRPPAGDREDGWLTAEEVSWLDLGAVDLVVLSACETGLGAPEAGEGMLGLRRALRQAGATTVVSSLWRVDDAATAELMRGFYRHLWSDGQPVAAALRRAQLEMLERNRRSGAGESPRTWGAFVVDGVGE